jgi:uncharacterized membrane protein YfcA
MQQFLLAMSVILGCSVVQGGLGFGYDLLALPLMVLLGFDLPQVLMILLVTSTLQTVMAVVQWRAAVDWRELAPVIVASVLGLPVGMALLRQLSFADPGTIQQAVGALVIVALVIRAGVRVPPRETVPAAAGWLAGFSGGLLGGLAGISGPPLVLWTYAHAWPGDKARVTPQAFSLPLAPLRLGLLCWMFPHAGVSSLPMAAALLPATVGGMWMGLRLGDRIAAPRLRAWAYALLLLLGLVCLGWPVLQRRL